jgi:murein L,D-transpeptidase YcbB/YkuD
MAKRSTPRFQAALIGAALSWAAPDAMAQTPAEPTAQAPAVTAPVVPAAPEAPAAAPNAPAPAASGQPTAPAAQVARPRPPAPPPAPRITALSTDPQPTYGPQTIAMTQGALARYRQIAQRGGWGTLPTSTPRIAKGSTGPLVLALKQRLATEGDLDINQSPGPLFDDVTVEAVKRFQRRVGHLASGAVTGPTIRQLNIPVQSRITALEKSLERLADSRFAFGPRYVVVNIPAAAAEAVEGTTVRRRHVVIVGKPEHASPMVETRLTVVNFNPTWTIPTSIIRRDIIPKMRRNPATLASMRVRMLDRNGNEVNPASINWQTEQAVNYTLRQDPGVGNSLGRVRIDMPNREAVYMHDTPSRRLFNSEARYFSSGCVRVGDVNDFVTWLLAPQGWDRARVDADMTQTQRKDVRLTQAVPVAWVYMTGWAAPDGTVQFRDDIYSYDAPGAAPVRVVRAADRPPAEPVVLAPQPPPPQPNFFESLFGGGRRDADDPPGSNRF